MYDKDINRYAVLHNVKIKKLDSEPIKEYKFEKVVENEKNDKPISFK